MNLPEKYSFLTRGCTPKSDWAYWCAARGPGAMFAGSGVTVNAEHAKQRLEREGLFEALLAERYAEASGA